MSPEISWWDDLVVRDINSSVSIQWLRPSISIVSLEEILVEVFFENP